MYCIFIIIYLCIINPGSWPRFRGGVMHIEASTPYSYTRKCFYSEKRVPPCFNHPVLLIFSLWTAELKAEFELLFQGLQVYISNVFVDQLNINCEPNCKDSEINLFLVSTSTSSGNNSFLVQSRVTRWWPSSKGQKNLQLTIKWSQIKPEDGYFRESYHLLVLESHHQIQGLQRLVHTRSFWAIKLALR